MRALLDVAKFRVFNGGLTVTTDEQEWVLYIWICDQLQMQSNNSLQLYSLTRDGSSCGKNISNGRPQCLSKMSPSILNISYFDFFV